MQKQIVLLIGLCFSIFTIQAQNIIYLSIGDHFQTVVDANPAGTIYIVKTGEHRQQEIWLKAGDYLIGEPGAIMNGSVVLDNWQFNGTTWEHDVSHLGLNLLEKFDVDCICQCFYPSPLDEGDQCGCDRYEGCQYAHDLFLNSQPLWRVIDPNRFDNQQDAMMRANTMYLPDNFVGEWHYDASTDKVYIYADPTEQVLELSAARTAIRGTEMTVKNLVVEKYHCNAPWGAIFEDGSGSAATPTLIENNETRWNHWKGIQGGPNYIIRNNHVHHNGGTGLAGNVAPETAQTLVENNEVSYNNYAAFNTGWDAGGMRLGSNNELQIRHNEIHHNNGIAIWADTDNQNVVYEGNIIKENKGAALLHKANFEGIFRCNTLEDNYFTTQDAAMFVDVSAQTDIYYNTFLLNETSKSLHIGQFNRGEIPSMPGSYYCTKDIYFHHNQQLIRSNIFPYMTSIFFDASSLVNCDPDIRVTFNHNRYHYAGGQTPEWGHYEMSHGGDYFTWAEMQANGQETCSTLDNDTSDDAMVSYSFCEALPLPLLVKTRLDLNCDYDFQNPPATFPLLQPFNQNPWFYSDRTIAPGLLPNAIDWVLIEARTPDYDATVVERKTGILLNDGRIVNPIAAMRGAAGVGDELDGLVFYDLSPEHSYLFSVWTSNQLYDIQLFMERVPNVEHLVFCPSLP